MKTKSVIRQLEKNLFRYSQNGRFYYSLSNDGKREFSFIDQEGSALCLHVKSSSEKSCSMTDYFPGSFRSNIKDCINFLKGEI